MKKMFLDDLPRRKDGKINWKKSVGHKVRFIHDDIEGEIEIVDYINSKLKIKYKNNELIIASGHLVELKIGRLLNKYTSEFKIDINTNFIDDKRNFTIIDREYRTENKNNWNEKWYKYHCNKCGNEDWMKEGHLTKNRGCNACCIPPQKVKLGINTIWDTDRWMVDIGMSEEDAKKYSKGSGKKIEVICPRCKTKSYKQIRNIHSKRSISCVCGDGHSYPEKVILKILSDMNIEYVHQLTNISTEWCENKRYDFYLKDYNTIIEVHGMQHYEYTGFKQSLLEEQENDKIKKELALKNGVKHYIVIDARKSDIEFIKNSVLNSELNNLFDLSKIDWLECEEFALNNSKIIDICNYWNNKSEHESIKEVSKVFEIHSKTLKRYLKLGVKIGVCLYNPKEELKNAHAKTHILKSKPVEILLNDVSLGIYKSATYIDLISKDNFGINFPRRLIGEVCRGNKKDYKGYVFRYV